MHYYRAPWDGMLKAMTAFSVTLLVVFSFLPLHVAPVPTPLKIFVPVLMMATLLGSWAYAPRGYEIDGYRLIVRRNIGSSEYDLRGLREIDASGNAMPLVGAVRIFGVGGIFGYYGKYYSSRLGSFTAWVTDRKRTVALKLNNRTVVVSPDDPKMFSEEVRASAGVV